jgi:hypothetical protein
VRVRVQLKHVIELEAQLQKLLELTDAIVLLELVTAQRAVCAFGCVKPLSHQPLQDRVKLPPSSVRVSDALTDNSACVL